MSTINDILILDLQEDIKNVIDLEDRSEIEIQQEIESYIVTEGIGTHLYNFTNQFTSNISETGVWLSGFYGSGKSYFGKMLGYIIDNPTISGTSARERFIPRLKGVSDAGLIETSIRKLDMVNSRVVFLDIAKQNTENGLAFTLFANLLKCLGFRDDLYGYIEFELFLDGKLEEFKTIASKLEGKKWDELKKNNRSVAKVMRSAHAKMGYSEADYADTKKVYEDSISAFSSSKFKELLQRYLEVETDETIVFIFDEASEAISQKKFTLLDLEGISEDLSSLGGKVWTIAIAQEKLDDVINNANVSKSNLTKVTDRFKTKIHLEATEVDVIIRSRLLQKTDAAHKRLVNYYNEKEGLVSDATNLKSAFPTKTSDAETFAICYPFHNYQFSILQKFLFSSNALVATQIAARGMIITTFDVLRKQMKDKTLHHFTTAYDICSEAQTSPPADLVNKYDTAKKDLTEAGSEIKGEALLKTIHLLADSEVVSPTVENITKAYISDITTYYDVKPLIEKALLLLVEEKVLLLSNHNYKITSDLEGKLLEEMKDLDVELYGKKRELIKALTSYKLFNPLASYSEASGTFKFSVLSDLGDPLSSSGDKDLNLCIYSLFTISEDRQDFIETVKMETQNDKKTITLIPDTTNFSAIDKLIAEVTRYTYMEEKYASESDQAKRQIIRDFSTIREEKEKELRNQIEAAYHNASLIYLFDEHLLNPNTFKSTTTEIQKKLVKNIYSKRLPIQLSEALAGKVFSARKEALSRLFAGDDYKFFDSKGTFTGEHLKVVDEINTKIKKRCDGKSLESVLSAAPWGYTYGTIVSTLAALFRAGRVSVKFNGDTYFSHEQHAVHQAFSNSTKFRSASFKSITAALSSAQKTAAVQVLMDLDIKDHTGRKVDWNTNDFDLADAISHMADHFLSALSSLDGTVDQFESLFPAVAAQKGELQAFSGKVTESNYIQKVEFLLSNKDAFRSAIDSILKAQKFIKKNFTKVKTFKAFIEQVIAELKKAGQVTPSPTITDAHDEFTRLYKADMVKNFAQLQQQTQTVKDEYFKQIKNAAETMTHTYQAHEAKVDAALRDLKKNYPPAPNAPALRTLEQQKCYAMDRIIKTPSIDYSVTCQDSDYSLSDILNYTALASQKETDLLILQSSFISEVPAPDPDPVPVDTAAEDAPGKTPPPPAPLPPKQPKSIKLALPSGPISVLDYKTLLSNQLKMVASLSPNEEINVEVSH
jgi:hypothetical protein